jgi:hypothetical protein
MKKVVLSDQRLNAIIRETKEKILAGLPASETSFDGERLMRLVQHRQVNNFLLFQIYQDWNAHVPSIAHAYFDFEHPEVKQALLKFVNSVSRHIRVQRKDLDLLLDRALFNTLRLILDPEETLVKFFFASALVIPLELYKRHSPYFSDFDFVIQSIAAYHEKNSLQEVRRDVFLEKYRRVLEIFEQKEGKTLHHFQRHYFQSLTGQDLDNVVGKDQFDMKQEAGKQPPVAPPVVNRPPVTPPPVAKPPVTPPPVVNTPPVTPPVTPPPVAKPPVTPPPVTPPPVAKPPVTPPPVVNTPPINPPSDKPSLADKFAQEKTSLSDRFSQQNEEKKASLNERFGSGDNPVSPEEKPIIFTKKEEPPVTPPVVNTPPPVTPPVTPPPVTPPPVVQKPPVTPPVTPPSTDKPSLADKFAQEKTSLSDRFVKQNEEKSVPLHERFGTNNPTPPAEEKPVTPPVVTPAPVVNTPVTPPVTVTPPPIVETPATPPIAEEKVQPPVIETPIDLFAAREEKPITPPSTDEGTQNLADKFRNQQQPKPLHEAVQGKAIRLEHIPVHKQFQFVQKVFSGSSIRFKVLLDKINETNSAAELEALLNQYVFSDTAVSRDDKVTQEFLILVRNRFES